MKAVVLDITGKEATVMTREGDILGISNKGYDIGQEIDIKVSGSKFAVKVYRYAPVLSAVAAAAVLLFAGIRMYFDPYGTVSLDVNPSIEYTINRFDRVLEVSGVNEDGSGVLSQINTDMLINKDIEDAVEATIDQIEAEGYISDEDGNFVVVSANTRKEEHTDKLLEKLDNKVKGRGNIKPLSFKVSDEELNAAHDEGISGGKKKIIDSLEELSGEKIDRSKWKGKSVRDIEEEYDRIKDGRHSDDEIEEESSERETVTSPEMPKQTEIMERPDNEAEDRHGFEGSKSKPEDEPEDEPEPGNNGTGNNYEAQQDQQSLENHQPTDFGSGQGEPPKDNSDFSPMQNDGGSPGEPDNMPPSNEHGLPGENGDHPQEPHESQESHEPQERGGPEPR